MEKTVIDIQALINQKADKRLENDVKELHELIYRGKFYCLLEGLKVTIDHPVKPYEITAHSIFGPHGYRQKIVEQNTQRYREEEAKNFLSRVDALRSDVDALFQVTEQYED